MTTTAIKPGVYDDLDNGTYHADPALSASGAKVILQAPAKFAYHREHPEAKEFKGIYDIGHAAHALVLGDSGPQLDVIDAPDWRKKETQVARRESRLAGRIPLLPKELAKVEAMAEAVKKHETAHWLLSQPGTCERSLFWTDQDSGVSLRARLDYAPEVPIEGRLLVPDYKTTNDASREGFAKTARNFQYHVQHAFYEEGIRMTGLAERVGFVFIAQETEAPYLVQVHELDPYDALIGRHLMREAISTFKQCIETDTWPGYPGEVNVISFPPYYRKQFEDVIA